MALLDDLLAGMLGGATNQQPAGRQPTSGGMGRQVPAAAGGMGGVLMALLPVVLSMLASHGGAGRGGPGPGTGGGGLSDVLGQVLGGGGRGGAGGVGDILGQVLGGGRQGGGQGGMGGLGGLLEQLQRTGYGEQANSWVGPGQNLPISPEAMEQIFGRDGVAAIARHAGVSETDASRGLSQLLPEVVDHVTPDGKVPDLDTLAASVEALTRRMR